MPENRSGLGTPATRAGVIERLIKSGLITRDRLILAPTAKGLALTKALPEAVKSPLLTADWEQKLFLVEKNELDAGAFMAGIEALVRGIVAAHTAPLPEMVALFDALPEAADKSGRAAPKGKPVGQCPRCGNPVIEAAKGFFCSSRACKFVLWKEARFWAAKGKAALSAQTAAALLKEGRVSFSDLKSERTGKTYAATVVLEDSGEKTNYRLEFNTPAV